MQDLRTTILDNALPLVPFDGWSHYTLKQAAKQAGASEAELQKAFPGGVKDCVEFFLSQENKTLEETFPPGSLDNSRIPERIEKIILARFSAWLPKREVIRKTISFNSMPWHSLIALKSLYSAVDLIWKLAGDSSTDFNFYTKRVTLAGVYSSTLLFWLNDTSSKQEETALFLKRRLGNVAEFGRLKKRVTECFN